MGMTKEELAAKLNGRPMGAEITDQESAQAKADGLLVVFCYSDDNCEFRGAIKEELSAYNGGKFFFNRNSIVPEIEDDVEEEILKKHGALSQTKDRIARASWVRAIWCESTSFAWTFMSSLPSATFDTMEGNEGFCRGIVIDIQEIPV